MPILLSILYRNARRALDSMLGVADRCANWVFTSKYNPLYRSGTLAVAFLIIASASGILLLFFYRVGAPYESVTYLHSEPLISWLRSVHRYASDLMLLAVVLHGIRMFVQGKSWGARSLAWTSGVILLALVLVTGWTGFVMVWDLEAQVIAQALGKMLDATSILSTPVSQAFSGSDLEPPGSFFFLLLFLHGVLPLSMLFGLWLHTSRMARASWFPGRRLFIGVLGITLIVSLTISAPLDQKANLFTIPSRITLNPFFNAWIPFVEDSPLLVPILVVCAFFSLLLLPLILSPRLQERPEKSSLDQLKCNGCVQCVLDCPYEAISMVPRTEGSLKLSEMVARVEPDLCVSCGLCAASCARMTVGPPGRKGQDQYLIGKQLIQHFQDQGLDLSTQTIIIGCTNQIRTSQTIQAAIGARADVQIYPVACMGSLHMGTIGHLAYYFRNLILAACPERNCSNKDAYMLLGDRLTGRRRPGLPGRVASSRVHLVPVGEGEEHKVLDLLNTISPSYQGRSDSAQSGTSHVGGQGKMPPRTLTQQLLTIAGALVLVSSLALASAWPYTRDIPTGTLRFSWRTSGQFVEHCRALSEKELAQHPIHMRTKELCERTYLSYRLSITLNGKQAYERAFHPSGLRSDNPLYVFGELPLDPGEYLLEAVFSPLLPDGHSLGVTQVLTLNISENITVSRGQVLLLATTSNQREFVLRAGEHS